MQSINKSKPININLLHILSSNNLYIINNNHMLMQEGNDYDFTIKINKIYFFYFNGNS